MNGRNHYSDEMKAAAMAALLGGQSVSKVAEEYRIPRGTVARWSSELRRDLSKCFEHEKKEAIGDLLIQYLEENLVTLREQSRHFRDAEWLREQGASEAAVLHGVLTDKTVRLLEALGSEGQKKEEN
jgi:transposase-like protein